MLAKNGRSWVRGLGDRLRILSEREALGEGPQDAKRFAELRQVEGLAADHVEEPQGSFEHPAWPGHARLRELGREYRLAAGLRRREILPVGQGSDAALIDRRVATDRNADRVHHLLRVEPHQPACAHHACKAQHGGLVETKSSGIEHVGDLAEHLVCERGGHDEITATAPGDLGAGEQGREGVARVAAAHRRDVPVIEIEIADHDAIGEHRELVARLDAAAEDGRSRCRAHTGGQLDGNPARAGLVAADRAADRIQDGALYGAHHIRRQILIAEPHGIVRERLRDRATAVGRSIPRPRSLRILLRHRRQSRRRSKRGACCRKLLQELTARIFRRIGQSHSAEACP